MRAYAAIAVVVMASGALAQVRSAASYREEIHAELRRLHGVEELRADALREAIARAHTILETPIVPAYGDEDDIIFDRLEVTLLTRRERLDDKTEVLMRHTIDELERAGVFDLIDQAARARAFVDGERWPLHPNDAPGDFDFANDQMRLVQSVLAAIYLANIDGDVARRDAMLGRALALIESINAYRTWIHHIFGSTAASMLCSEATDGLNDRQHGAGELRSLQRFINGVELAPIDELVLIETMIHIWVEDDGRRSAAAIRRMREAAPEIASEALALSRTEPRNRTIIHASVTHDVIPGDAWILAARLKWLGTIEHYEINQTTIDATRIVIALEQYRLEHGAYPDTLTPLAPLLGGEVPLDWISWAPFRYEVTDGNVLGGYRLLTSTEPPLEYGVSAGMAEQEERAQE